MYNQGFLYVLIWNNNGMVAYYQLRSVTHLSLHMTTAVYRVYHEHLVKFLIKTPTNILLFVQSVQKKVCCQSSHPSNEDAVQSLVSPWWESLNMKKQDTFTFIHSLGYKRNPFQPHKAHSSLTRCWRHGTTLTLFLVMMMCNFKLYQRF